MTPAEHAKAIERAVEIYSRDFAIYCDTQALTDFRACSVSLATLQAAIQAGVGAPAQAMPAPGVEAVSEREFKQFLSDVITAAGLVTHGNKCKDLGRRLGEMSMRLLTAPASQPFAYEFSRSNGDGTHSEHIERGRLQEVAPGRWEHSGLPRGALADKPIKALYTTPQTQPAAVLASGPVGFDHKTAANFLNGKTVTDEEVRRFVACSRWAHDDRDGLRNTIADLRREIAQRDAEIALLKISLIDAESPTQAAQAQHPDDAAVEKLAESMKQKLAEKRAQGRSGWDTDCTQQRLSDLLRQHVEKGDVLDVANFCAFLFARGERVSAAQAQPACQPPKSWNKRGQDAYRRGWEDRGNSMIDPAERYLEGCRDGYAQRDAEVMGALA